MMYWARCLAKIEYFNADTCGLGRATSIRFQEKKHYEELRPAVWVNSAPELKESYSYTSRYRAILGGAFAFEGHERAASQFYINCLGFYSNVGKKSWLLIRKDYFPISLNRLNNLQLSQHPSAGASYSTVLFPPLRGETAPQPINYASSYNRFFLPFLSSALGRGETALRMYADSRLDPIGLIGANTTSAIGLCRRGYEMSRLLNASSRGGAGRFIGTWESVFDIQVAGAIGAGLEERFDGLHRGPFRLSFTGVRAPRHLQARAASRFLRASRRCSAFRGPRLFDRILAARAALRGVGVEFPFKLRGAYLNNLRAAFSSPLAGVKAGRGTLHRVRRMLGLFRWFNRRSTPMLLFEETLRQRARSSSIISGGEFLIKESSFRRLRALSRKRRLRAFVRGQWYLPTRIRRRRK